VLESRQSRPLLYTSPEPQVGISGQPPGLQLGPNIIYHTPQSVAMRFYTFPSLSFLAVLVSAQTSGTSASTSDLMAEFAELPMCVVRIKKWQSCSLHRADTHMRSLAQRDPSLYLQNALRAILLVCVTTRNMP